MDQSSQKAVSQGTCRSTNQKSKGRSHAQQTAKKSKQAPTTEEYRTTGRASIRLDPGLSGDEAGEGEDESDDSEVNQHVRKVLTQNVTRPPSKPGKPRTIGSQHRQHMTIHSTDEESLPSRDQPSLKDLGKEYGSGEESTDKEGERQGDSEEPGDEDMDLFEVANGELMNLEQFRLVLNDYPDVMYNPDVPVQFGRMATSSKSKNTTGRNARTTNSTNLNRQIGGVSLPKGNSNPQPALHSNENGVNPIKKTYPKDLSASHITPHQKRQMTRMPSTTTTIGGALGIPSLAKASLEEMKGMLAIWSRTRDNLARSMQDLRTPGYNIKTPSAYETLATHHKAIDMFCSRLGSQIQDAETSGLSNEIEVVDFVDLTRDARHGNPADRSNLRLKRPSAQDPPDFLLNKRRTQRPSANTNNKANKSKEHKGRKSPTPDPTERSEAEDEEIPPPTKSKSQPKNNKSKKTKEPSGHHSAATNAGTASNRHKGRSSPTPDPTERSKGEDEERAPPTKSKSQTISNPKGQKKQKKNPAEMTEEEKAKQKEEAERRKQEKKNSPYNNPPNPGSLLSKIWKASDCQKMYNQYTRMLEMSKNPQWDYGLELMELVADMVGWSSGDTMPGVIYEKQELFSPTVEELEAICKVRDPEFRDCLTSTAGDPFFHEHVINLNLIQDACTSKAKSKCSSWKAVYSMMIRTDAKDDYTNNIHTHPLLSAGFRKLHTLSESCSENLPLYLTPSIVSKKNPIHWKQDTLFEAGKYVIGRIKTLKAIEPVKSNNNGNGRTPNGLVVLQKRIWETLLCCLMMQNSFFIDYLEECIKTNTFPDKSIEAAAKMSPYQRDRSLFKEGDVKDINSTKEMKERGKIRLSAFGSMAVFFLYGAAGWWHCLTDSHNFNQRDVWSLVHLAHARHDWLYNKRRVKERRTDDTPWYQIDSFVRWLLREAKMDCLVPSEVDWEMAPRFWAEHVNEKNISRLAIQDIMVEVCSVQPRKSYNFKGEEAPDVKLRRPNKEMAENLKGLLTAAWKPMIAAHERNIEDDLARDELDQEHQDSTPSQPSKATPLFKPPSPFSKGPTGPSAASLMIPGKIRKPRAETETEEEDKEDHQSVKGRYNQGRGTSETSGSGGDSKGEDESSGTDPSRDSSDWSE
ncbi:Golgi to ER traffic- protein [Puccinia graminis f. sp. tritici]|uniref:Golgi to ER traffic-protein n=1 Tax=Puccinia graminis f. sp. tritici TaxID=56615 RepID=A0A5B0NNU3_PUCGR|nr:Golgi to ER traffic- protein [Puccinia graminis f. sp. tritici]